MSSGTEGSGGSERSPVRAGTGTPVLIFPRTPQQASVLPSEVSLPDSGFLVPLSPCSRVQTDSGPGDPVGGGGPLRRRPGGRGRSGARALRVRRAEAEKEGGRVGQAPWKVMGRKQDQGPALCQRGRLDTSCLFAARLCHAACLRLPHCLSQLRSLITGPTFCSRLLSRASVPSHTHTRPLLTLQSPHACWLQGSHTWLDPRGGREQDDRQVTAGHFCAKHQRYGLALPV